MVISGNCTSEMRKQPSQTLRTWKFDFGMYPQALETNGLSEGKESIPLNPKTIEEKQNEIRNQYRQDLVRRGRSLSELSRSLSMLSLNSWNSTVWDDTESITSISAHSKPTPKETICIEKDAISMARNISFRNLMGEGIALRIADDKVNQEVPEKERSVPQLNKSHLRSERPPTRSSSSATRTKDIKVQHQRYRHNNAIVFKPSPEDSDTDPNGTPLFFFENERQLDFDRKMTLASAFLRSYVVVINQGIDELSRIECLVLATARANQAFHDAMKASLVQTRIGKGSYDPTITHDSDHSCSTSSTISNKSSTVAFHEAMTSLFDAQTAIADQLAGNARHVFSSISQEISHLQEEVGTRSTQIERTCDAIMQEMESSEVHVRRHWDAYNKLAVSSSSALDLCALLEESDSETQTDLWLLEMRYHVAVAYQASLWNKMSRKLVKCFRAAREKEHERRIRLQGILLDFVSKQKRVMGGFSPTHSGIIQELVDHSKDCDLENEIKDTLSDHVAAFYCLEKEEQAQEQLELDTTSSLEAQEQLLLSDMAVLENPTSSKLVAAIKVVERMVINERTNKMRGWQKTIAITTADNFLHFFDLPPGVETDGQPQEVFLETLPRLQSLASRKSPPNLLCIAPEESLFLPHCSFDYAKDNWKMSTEIKITRRNFCSENEKKNAEECEVLLRSLSPDNSEEWLTFIYNHILGEKKKVPKRILSHLHRH